MTVNEIIQTFSYLDTHCPSCTGKGMFTRTVPATDGLVEVKECLNCGAIFDEPEQTNWIKEALAIASGELNSKHLRLKHLQEVVGILLDPAVEYRL